MKCSFQVEVEVEVHNKSRRIVIKPSISRLQVVQHSETLHIVD